MSIFQFVSKYALEISIIIKHFVFLLIK